MGSKKCFNAKKFFFLFFSEYLPLILGVPINVGVPNPNFRGTYPPEYHFFKIKIDDTLFKGRVKKKRKKSSGIFHKGRWGATNFGILQN